MFKEIYEDMHTNVLEELKRWRRVQITKYCFKTFVACITVWVSLT